MNFKDVPCNKADRYFVKCHSSGRKAIRILHNLQLTQLVFSTELVIFPKNALIFEISENPHLSITIIQLLKNLCPKCVITANLGTLLLFLLRSQQVMRKQHFILGCDLASRYYSDKELVAACAGKRIIRPASGFMLQLSSPRTTEAQFNAICSKAVFMEICIIITNTAYKSLRCPYLKELHPCQPGALPPPTSILSEQHRHLLVTFFSCMRTIFRPTSNIDCQQSEVLRISNSIDDRHTEQ